MSLAEEYREQEVADIIRWLKVNVDEYRCTYIPSLPLHELLAFIYPARIGELGDLLERTNADYFSEEGGLIRNIAYNGSDLVVDILPILKRFDINPKVITDEYRGGDE